MTKFMEDLKEYKRLSNSTGVYGRKVIRQLVRAIKPTIPDIKAILGGYESGIDTINFESDSHTEFNAAAAKRFDSISLDEVIENVFSAFRYPSVICVDCWCGVYVNAEEADKITDALITLRDGGK